LSQGYRLNRIGGVCLGVAYTWLLGNAAYVYLGIGGRRAYRVESALLVFIAIVALLALWRPKKPSEWPPSSSLGPAFIWISLLAALFVYLPLLSFPFLSDDYVFLWRHVSGAGVGERWQFFRPVFAAIVGPLWVLGGGAPWPFHVAAVGFHLANASLVFLLAKRVSRSPSLAAIASMMFALNPLQLEAVLWMSGLQELLWTGFLLAALLVYTGREQLRAVDLVLSAALVVLALGAKETAICYLLVLPAADGLLFGWTRGRWQLPAYACLSLVAAGYLVLRYAYADVDAGFLSPPSRYFLKQLMTLPYQRYMLPLNRAAVHIPVWVGFLSVSVGATGLLIATMRGTLGKYILVGPVLILMSTIPVYAYFYVAPDLQGSRYLYFPTVGWGILVGHLLISVFRSRRTLVLAATVLLVTNVILLRVNLRPWHAGAQIVRELYHEPAEGAGPVTRERWRERYGDGLVMEDGVPREYRGVVLFRNGYDEFVKLRQSKQLPR
jgi:hypothetical protein